MSLLKYTNTSWNNYFLSYTAMMNMLVFHVSVLSAGHLIFSMWKPQGSSSVHCSRHAQQVKMKILLPTVCPENSQNNNIKNMLLFQGKQVLHSFHHTALSDMARFLSSSRYPVPLFLLQQPAVPGLFPSFWENYRNSCHAIRVLRVTRKQRKL